LIYCQAVEVAVGSTRPAAARETEQQRYHANATVEDCCVKRRAPVGIDSIGVKGGHGQWIHTERLEQLYYPRVFLGLLDLRVALRIVVCSQGQGPQCCPAPKEQQHMQCRDVSVFSGEMQQRFAPISVSKARRFEEGVNAIEGSQQLVNYPSRHTLLLLATPTVFYLLGLLILPVAFLSMAYATDRRIECRDIAID
jgi:hypothetical protein